MEILYSFVKKKYALIISAGEKKVLFCISGSFKSTTILDPKG